VSLTQLTDEPCPKCGASLDIEISIPSEPVAPGGEGENERATVRVKRIKSCPECGWSVEV
jgi:predicted RNA-binding Zn-ribbon protein involved in translation (DUF1610 family)